MRFRKGLVGAISVAAFSIVSSTAFAQTAGTALIYQGQLKQSGMPTDGLCDFEFSLWDDSRSTDPRDQIGLTLTLKEQPVADGLFTLELDFGNGAFDGDARYLEIAVRRSGLGPAHETLSPRQEVTPTPYSIMALNAVGVDGHSLDAEDGDPRDAVFVDKNGNVGVGTTGPRSTLDVDGLLTTTGFKLSLTPTAGHVLMSDAFGVGTWQAPPAGSDSLWLTNRNDIYYSLGNVGVGTSTPSAALDVAGGIAVDGFRLGDSATTGHVLTTNRDGVGTWQAPPTGGGFCPWDDGPEDHIFYNDGNVGIGTGGAVTPVQTLHVEGSAYVKDRVGIGVVAPTRPLDVRGDARVYNGNLLLGAEGFDPYIELMSDESSDATEMRLTALDGVGFAVTNSVGTPRLVVQTGGDVGIGTTTPAHPLHVVSSGVRAVVGETSATNGRGVQGEVTGSSGYGVYGQAVGGTGVHGEASSTSGGKGVSGWVESSTGIGVAGYNDAGSGDAIAVKGVSGHDAGYGGYFEGAGYFSTRLGVGTLADASTTLRVTNSGIGASSHGIRAAITNPSASSDAAAGYFSSVGTSGKAIYAEAEGGSSIDAYQTGSSGHAIWAHNNNSDSSILVTNAGTGDLIEGKVGTNSVFRVAKTGITHVDVLAVEGGADLAERFDVGSSARPGMVVEIDPQHVGKLRVAQDAYSRRVAGVISGANGVDAGMILGDLPGDQDTQPVALSGRVWVYCDATQRPIGLGDLLTTAERSGHAMAVADYRRAQGAVIGKAMTALKEGTGLVLVLVSLQ